MQRLRALSLMLVPAVLSAALIGAPDAALADPGVDGPSSYSPSEASATTVPTQDTPRARTNGVLTNGQDFDHYCKASWTTKALLAGSTSGQTSGSPMVVSKKSVNPVLAGDNGLLYTNQWLQTSTQPFYRVAWATDYATSHGELVIHLGPNWTGGTVVNGTFVPYSTDPTTLLSQVQIWSGASKFRTYDWSTYVLGLQGRPPYSTATSYVPGPYIGVNSNLFTLNPSVVTTTAPAPYTDPYYPNPDQYVPNLDPSNPRSFAKRIAYDPVAKTITVDMGNQPAGAMIVFGIGGQSDAVTAGTLPASATSEAYPLSATFTADYPSTDPTNTVCYPVSASWSKTDAATDKALPGSAWSLTPTGDTATAGSAAPVVVGDDTSGSATASGTDTDSAPGQLGVSTDSSSDLLQPGTWALSETKAPVGYSVDPTARPVTLDFTHQHVDLGAIHNSNTPPTLTADPVSVPMTGPGPGAGRPLDLRSGVTATDAQDGVLTPSVVVVDDGGFDQSKPGRYTITYRVTDAAGLSSTLTRTVTVTDAAPVITAPAATVTAGGTRAAALMGGITVRDPEDGDLTSKVRVLDDGGFDPARPGTYVVTYTVSDSGGVTRTVTRTITVKARIVAWSQTYQVDRYDPVVPGNPAATAANKALISRLVASGSLQRGADFGTGCYTHRHSPTCMWERTRHQVVTVTVKAPSDQPPTAQQWMAAVNASTGRTLGVLRTTSRTGSATTVTGPVTVAWRLQTALGATPALPFGPKRTVSQPYLARS